MLSDAAYQVTSAASGMEALDLIRQDVPDVLVLDIAMPGISGLTVAQDARQATPGLPIVFISGHAHREAIDAAHLSDAQLLRKPFLSHELNAAIRRCLDGRSAAH
jgi:CheY-like chemotaxis protein